MHYTAGLSDILRDEMDMIGSVDKLHRRLSGMLRDEISRSRQLQTVFASGVTMR